MFPAYDKQSGTLLGSVDATVAPTAAAADVAIAVDPVDLVVSASGMTPRQSGMQALITPRRLQHGLWSRPPAAQRARIANTRKRKVPKSVKIIQLIRNARYLTYNRNFFTSLCLKLENR